MKTRTDEDIEAREEAIKATATDPFESLAEPPPAQEPNVKKAAAKKTVAKKAVKRTPVKARSVDAFDAPAKVSSDEAVVNTASSPAKKAPAKSKRTTKVAAAKKVKTVKTGIDVTSELAAKTPEIEVSPVFKALAEPALPVLEHENRARLLMQSPTKLYFYWTVKENPYHLLREAFGSDTGSYTLVLKLTDLKHDTERILPAEAEGNNWFDVEPDGE